MTEFGAGRRLLHAVQETKTGGYMIAVTRMDGTREDSTQYKVIQTLYLPCK